MTGRRRRRTSSPRPGYWRRHLREPVRFAAVFDTLRAAGCTHVRRDRSAPHPARPRPARTGRTRRRRGCRRSARARAMGRDAHRAGRAVRRGRSGRLDGLRPRPSTAAEAGRCRPTRGSASATGRPPAARAVSVDAGRARSGRPRSRAAAPPGRAGSARPAARRLPGRWELLDALATAFIVGRAARPRACSPGAGERHRPADLVARRPGRRPATSTSWPAGSTTWPTTGCSSASDDGAFTAVEPLPGSARSSSAAGRGPARLRRDRAAARLRRALRHAAGRRRQRAGERAGHAVPRRLLRDGRLPLRRLGRGPLLQRDRPRRRRRPSRTARPGRPIRVLEVGAGTGGTTAAVLPGAPGRAHALHVHRRLGVLPGARRRALRRVPVRALRAARHRAAADRAGLRRGGVRRRRRRQRAPRHPRPRRRRSRTSAACSRPAACCVAYEATHHPRWFDVTTGADRGLAALRGPWRTDHAPAHARPVVRGTDRRRLHRGRWRCPACDQPTASSGST